MNRKQRKSLIDSFVQQFTAEADIYESCMVELDKEIKTQIDYLQEQDLTVKRSHMLGVLLSLRKKVNQARAEANFRNPEHAKRCQECNGTGKNVKVSTTGMAR